MNSDVPGELLHTEEWVHDADGTVEPVVLKIFGKDFLESIVFRIRP